MVVFNPQNTELIVGRFSGNFYGAGRRRRNKDEVRLRQSLKRDSRERCAVDAFPFDSLPFDGNAMDQASNIWWRADPMGMTTWTDFRFGQACKVTKEL